MIHFVMIHLMTGLVWPVLLAGCVRHRVIVAGICRIIRIGEPYPHA